MNQVLFATSEGRGCKRLGAHTLFGLQPEKKTAFEEARGPGHVKPKVAELDADVCGSWKAADASH